MDVIACELMTTASCPNSCAYCYLPRSEAMNRKHRELIEYLSSGAFLEALKPISQNVQELGFWGAEPTVNLDDMGQFLGEIKKLCPNLQNINFSTSLIQWKPIERFARLVAENGLHFKVQISLDGPAFVSDRNRFKGAAELVPDHFFALVNALQDTECSVDFQWKSTLTKDNIITMVEDPERVHEWVTYFQEINRRFYEINRSDMVRLDKNSYAPTLEVPGRYTVKDGHNFAEFVKLLQANGEVTAYTYRVLHMFLNRGWNFFNRSSVTCSAGNTNFGLSFGKLNMCHQTFCFDDEEVAMFMAENETDKPHDYMKNILSIIKHRYMVNSDDASEKARFSYVMRSYHDFWRFSNGIMKSLVMELAKAGQVDHSLLQDEAKLETFCLFGIIACGCPASNLINTGSMYIPTASTLRIFGNGAFEEILHGLPLARRGNG